MYQYAFNNACLIINYDILHLSAECIRSDFISIYIKDYNLKIDAVKYKEKSFLQYVKFADIALNLESNIYLYPRTSIQEKYVLLKIIIKDLLLCYIFWNLHLLLREKGTFQHVSTTIENQTLGAKSTYVLYIEKS